MTYSDGSLAQVCDAETGQPFPNNQIPPEKISLMAPKLAAYSPTPNALWAPATGQWCNTTAVLSNPWDWDQAHLRLDHTLSSNDVGYARFSWANEKKNTYALNPWATGKFPQTNRNLAVSDTHTFSPTVVNEACFGWNRTFLGKQAPGAYGPDIAKEMGFKKTTEIPASFGPPVVYLSNVSGFGADKSNLYQLEHFFHVADLLLLVGG